MISPYTDMAFFHRRLLASLPALDIARPGGGPEVLLVPERGCVYDGSAVVAWMKFDATRRELFRYGGVAVLARGWRIRRSALRGTVVFLQHDYADFVEATR